MKIKFYQTEGGNITVVDIGNNLLIKADTPGTFLVSNPTSPRGWGIHEIEIDQKATPEEIFEKIEAYYSDLKQVVG